MTAYLSAEAVKGERIINVLRLCIIALLAGTELAELGLGAGMPERLSGLVFNIGWLWLAFGAAMLWTVNYRRVFQPWFKFAVPVADALFAGFAALSLRDDIGAGADAFFYFLIGVSLFRVNRKAVWTATAATACAYVFAQWLGARYGFPAQTAWQLWINVGMMALFGVLCSFAAGSALERGQALVNDRVYRERLENAFSKYVPYHVANEIFAAGADLEVAGRGHSARVAVLIADIRGFTKMARTLAPAKLMALLNEHFYQLGDLVFMHGGAVNKFVGDSIIAVFGDPLKLDDPCLCAAKCAAEIVKAVSAANAAGRTPGLEVGIGLHFGEIVAGNLGSEDRIEYAVLGDTVNMTERIQSCARPGEILASGVFADSAGEEFKWLPSEKEFMLKGYSEPVKLFRLDCA
ncbi:MAG: adenylate/guanylate cyclase domain-containing protein [Elusimicrobiaceae bacterium]|nr:adenylate/guanylate cyclase domain-containing protein [Elusimicrobiaceae bacterium]